jgi:tyrosyl-tRNA synthetase
VRRHEVPADIQTVPEPEGVRTTAGVRVDKLLAKIGLAVSVSDAVRKIKAGAVEINGQRVHDLVLADASAELIVHAGKNWRRVVTQS